MQLSKVCFAHCVCEGTAATLYNVPLVTCLDEEQHANESYTSILASPASMKWRMALQYDMLMVESTFWWLNCLNCTGKDSSYGGKQNFSFLWSNWLKNYTSFPWILVRIHSMSFLFQILYLALLIIYCRNFLSSLLYPNSVNFLHNIKS